MISMLLPMVLCGGGVCGCFCLMDFWFSRMSTWYRLRACYPAPPRPAGVSYSSSSISFWRAGNQRGVHTSYFRGPRVIFTDAGLYCYFGPLSGMAVFHQPLLLAWPTVKQLWKTGRPFEEMLHVRFQAEALEFELRLREKAQPEFFKYYRQAHEACPSGKRGTEKETGT